jgi:uncharacterized protein YuzE
MKMSYDPKADALYIKLRNGKIEESDEIAEGIIVDYGEKGKPLGIEFLDAATLFGGRHEMRVELALTEELKA